jgi:rare lipoprotein A (peptidoglycan hydrolase)
MRALAPVLLSLAMVALTAFCLMPTRSPATQVTTDTAGANLALERFVPDARASRSARQYLTRVNTDTPVSTTTTAPPPPPKPKAAPKPKPKPQAATAKAAPAPKPAPKPAPAPAPQPKPTSPPPPPAPTNSQTGQASYYSDGHGECAHRTLPIGTRVKVTNTANGKATTCTVTNRGPFVEGRIIDLAKSTFAEIAPTSQGVINVRIEW